MTKRMTCTLFFTFLLGGCSTQLENPPLVFGKSLTVGIGISGSAPQQSAEVTLGVSSKNIAVVPVTTSQPNGAHTQITSTVGDGQSPDQDSLSVLGQFSANTQTGGQSNKILLGEFFATGLAAQKLADGFAAQLGLEEEDEVPAVDNGSN